MGGADTLGGFDNTAQAAHSEAWTHPEAFRQWWIEPWADQWCEGFCWGLCWAQPGSTLLLFVFFSPTLSDSKKM
jgi:hypothetical protein